MVQLAPGATLEPQVLVCMYSFVPVMLEMFNVWVDEFDRVAFMTLLVWPTIFEPKLSEIGLSVTLVPVPLRCTNCGLDGSESVTLRVPLRRPVAVGAKATVTW